jgi:amino acid transporter
MSPHDSDVKIGLITIWAIGVGSALGGDFFGWQFILYGGFGSAFIAVAFTGIFYWIYAKAITELAARYQSSGGSFDFVKNAIGRRSAAIMAILELLKLILANSANALAISSYLVQAGLKPAWRFVCWIVTYASFCYLDCIGVKQSANAQVIATIFCVLLLIFYSASSLSVFNIRNIISAGYTRNGLNGFLQGLPFALQFFDGFEEVPLLLGYAYEPERTIPRAILACYVTVLLIAVMILISGSGSTRASELLDSEAPLMDGFDLVYGTGTVFSDIIAYFIVIGLIVNFFAFVLFSSQQVAAVAEAKQLPAFLAYRHPVHGAPINASITASLVGIILTAGFAYVFGDDPAQNTLVTAALLPAVLGYALLLQCIVKIRQVEAVVEADDKCSPRDKERLGYDPGTLRFEQGTNGARIAQAMCLFFLIGLFVLAFAQADFMYGIIVIAIFGTISYLAMKRFIVRDREGASPMNGLMDQSSRSKPDAILLSNMSNHGTDSRIMSDMESSTAVVLPTVKMNDGKPYLSIDRGD